MKKLLIFLCLIFTTLSLHARAIQEDRKIAEENARISYAFGMIIGLDFDLGSFGLEFDYNALAEGLRAAIESNESLLSYQEAIEIVENTLYLAMERASEENRFIEEEFLIRNAQRPNIYITQSGLQYEIIEEAEGEKPNAESIVKVNYVGTFVDGRPFDSSFDEDGTYIPLVMVIPGWTEGVMLMSVGSIYRFYIPSHLAYGKDGFHGFIPPYSTLIFTIELLEITDEDEWEF